jgi:hypothetical protein
MSTSDILWSLVCIGVFIAVYICVHDRYGLLQVKNLFLPYFEKYQLKKERGGSRTSSLVCTIS